MNIAQKVLNLLHRMLSFVVAAALLVTGAYAIYSLWDNHRIYSAADDVQIKMQELKPKVEDGQAPSFEELIQINSEICGWITIDNTNIDYPVLQGKDNFAYINTDVYGNFALAGSIFLDVCCKKDFSEPYALLYGHHMANSKMFGDLDLFKDKAFFDANTKGTLLTIKHVYPLEIIAVMTAAASDKIIFDRDSCSTTEINALLRFVSEKALYYRADRLRQYQADPDTRILVLATCAADFTDARTVLITAVQPCTG